MNVPETILYLHKNCKDIIFNVTNKKKNEDAFQFKVNLQINVIWQFFQICKIGAGT